MLRDPSHDERRVLGAIRYHPNHAVLHTDASVLPNRQAAWAAWNYESAVPAGTSGAPSDQHVCLHYLINRLQPLPWEQPVVVSLNPLREIPRSQIMGEYDYAHPVFDVAAIKAQGEVAHLQGKRNTYFCGAWMGYGFHEDGLRFNSLMLSSLKTQKEHESKPHGDFDNFLPPEDIVPVIRFLLSRESYLVNGNVISLFRHSETFYNSGFFQRIAK